VVELAGGFRVKDMIRFGVRVRFRVRV